MKNNDICNGAKGRGVLYFSVKYQAKIHMSGLINVGVRSSISAATEALKKFSLISSCLSQEMNKAGTAELLQMCFYRVFDMQLEIRIKE